MQEPDLPDLDAIEKQFRAHHVPKLSAGLDGKLRADSQVRALTPEEQAREAKFDKLKEDSDKARQALVRAMSHAEGEWLEKHIGKLIPDYLYKPAHRKAMQGDTWEIRKLMNEYEVKIQQVKNPGQEGEDMANGVIRRHWQVLRAGKVIFEHVWEWTAG